VGTLTLDGLVKRVKLKDTLGSSCPKHGVGYRQDEAAASGNPHNQRDHHHVKGWSFLFAMKDFVEELEQ